jgi:hypothetical protein
MAKPFGLVEAKAYAETHQEDDRHDAPDDAEHGEKTAELGVPQGGNGLAEDLEDGHRLLGGYVL